MKKKLILVFVFTGVLFLLVVGMLIMHPPLRSGVYRVYFSPKGDYRIEVYQRFYIITSPGGGGDVPGVVFLKNKKGDVIRKKNVEMVNLIHNPEWREKGVYIHFVLDWSFE